MRVSKALNDFAWWRPTDRELAWAIRLHRLFDIFDRGQDLLSAFHLWSMARHYARRERASEVFADQERVGLYDDLDEMVTLRLWETGEVSYPFHELDSRLIIRELEQEGGNETQ